MTVKEPTYNLLHTRVRYDLEGLNSEASGWIAAEDADNFDVNWGTVFRIRARITETAGNGANNALMKWQFNRESAGWVDINPHDHATSTAVVAVPNENFSDNDVVSTQYLTSGGGSFINGEGDTTGDFDVDVDNEETEVEGSFMFMNYYDDGYGNSDGDSFEFRVVESDGTVFSGTDNTVTITLNTVDYYIGSTYPETVGRNLNVDDDGNLYMLVDITEGNPDIGILKSADGGKSWILQDNANRPARFDAEAVDIILENDRLYISYVNAGDESIHYTFLVSTHSTAPDTWDVDEELTSGVSKNQNPQTIAIERFDNGDLVIFYMRDNGAIDSGYYQVKNGTWGSEQTLDAEASHFFKGVTCVKDTNNLVHIFYKMLEDGVEGVLYHRSLSEGGTLSGREVVDGTTGSTATNEEHWFVMVAPPVAWQDGSEHNVMVVYRDLDNKLYSSVVTNDGSPETVKAASDNTVRASPGGTDSGQPTGALAIDGDDIYLHYVDLTTADLYRDKNTNDGSWGTDTEEEDAANIYAIRSHVFTHSAGNGGAKVIGYTYENDPVVDGGMTGFIWYGEYEISVGGNFQDVAGVLTAVGILSKETGKTPAGSVTGSGILKKSSSKAFTGSVTSAGILVKQTAKLFVGSVVASGILSTAKTTLLAIGGVITASGILVKQTTKTFVGSVISTGILVKQTAKSLTGSVTASGIVTTTKVTLLAIGGTITAAGVLIKQTSKSMAGSVAAVGVLVKQTGKVLLGSLTLSGILATTKVTLLSISGSLTLSGLLVRQTGKIVLGSLTATGSLVRQTAKTFVGTVTVAGSLIKQTAKSLIGSITTVGSLATQKISGGYFQVVGGTVTMVGTLTRQTNKIFTGSVTTVGILVKRTIKAFTGAITTTGSLATQKIMFQVISGVLTMAGGLVRQTGKQTAGIVAMTGSITKRISKSFTGAITAIGTLVRQLIGLPVPASRIYAIKSESRVDAISIEKRIFSIVKENRIFSIGGSYASLSIPSWVVGTSKVGGLDQIT